MNEPVLFNPIDSIKQALRILATNLHHLFVCKFWGHDFIGKQGLINWDVETGSVLTSKKWKIFKICGRCNIYVHYGYK